jgi:hypothetical protein
MGPVLLALFDLLVSKVSSLLPATFFSSSVSIIWGCLGVTIKWQRKQRVASCFVLEFWQICAWDDEI